MVSLMDRLLKLENLDLHLTPYRVLATGQDEGMLEFIPSSSLAQVVYPLKEASLMREVCLMFIMGIYLVSIDNWVPTRRLCFYNYIRSSSFKELFWEKTIFNYW